MEGFIISLVLLSLLPISITFAQRKEKKRILRIEMEESLREQTQRTRKEMIDTIISKFEVPTNSTILMIKKWIESGIENNTTSQFWCDEDTLRILVIYEDAIKNKNKETIDYDKIIFKEIKLDNIQFYFNTGNFYTETEIRGGSGGGSSLSGAIVGGALFGGAGAVIGSRKEIDPITSKLLITDTRETVIKYREEGKDHFIHIAFDEMRNLYSLLPGKGIDELYHQKARSIDNQFTEINLVKEKLIKLNDLKDANLVSDNEYEEKRRELLSLF